MKNNKFIIAVVAIVVLIGFILILKAASSKGKAKTSAQAAQAQMKKGIQKAPANKVISKGKGGLTVRMFNSKNVEIPMRVKAFKVADSKSSVYAASSVGGRMQEVLPGTYDIEIDTVPQKIYKNIKVERAKEAVADLGCITGSLIIRTLNAKKASAYYPMRILYPKTGDMVTAYMTNKAIELIPGVYDIEVGTSPRIYRKDVKVDAGKEIIIDMGCVVGSIQVKTIDENKKSVRANVRVTRADTNEIVSSTSSNRTIELGKGSYNVEVLSYPKQTKKDVKVALGEETVVEFTVAAPKPAAPRPQAPAKVKQQ